MWPTLKLDEDLFKWVKPSNDRQWSPGQQVLPSADINGDQVAVHNIRSCHYRTYDDFDTFYYDKTFDLSKLTSVDMIVVPFNDIPSIAHTMLSFGFADEDYLAVSVEIRKEKGEKDSPIKGFFRQYELIYVLADERDVIPKNANQYPSEVYLYRSTATPQQARELFVDVMKRVNKLMDEPEFYNTLSNNCTTNIRDHINHLKADRVPYDYRILLPGYSDSLAYDLGLIVNHGSFQQTKTRAQINYQAYLYRNDADFSQKIRR
ncbi:MAG: Lnb N-terminal periplasmic domain-containing protein [Thermoguttaceae bacterium]